MISLIWLSDATQSSSNREDQLRRRLGVNGWNLKKIAPVDAPGERLAAEAQRSLDSEKFDFGVDYIDGSGFAPTNCLPGMLYLSLVAFHS